MIRRDGKYSAEAYAQLKADGICVDCQKRPAGIGVRCDGCTEMHNSHRRERYRKARERDECPRCGGPANGRSICTACYVHEVDQQKPGTERRRYRCSICGENGHSKRLCRSSVDGSSTIENEQQGSSEDAQDSDRIGECDGSGRRDAVGARV